jgi:hypothetical protein
MINFATLQGLTIPEGEVTQIADASGRVLWVVQSADVPIVLKVKTSYNDTYVGGTSRTEKFLLLDIYPKTSNSVVNVTYGELTKTLTFSGTDAQQVYFGTFGGVSDGVTTPDTGTLIIEGGCIGVGNGTYNISKSSIGTTTSILSIIEWGGIKIIPNNAFSNAYELTSAFIPEGVPSIGDYAFEHCSSLTNVHIPSSVTSIGDYAFYGCFSTDSTQGLISALRNVYIPASVTGIGRYVFSFSIENIEFGNTSGWYVTETEGGDASTGIAVDVSDPAANATMLSDTYNSYYWYRS